MQNLMSKLINKQNNANNKNAVSNQEKLIKNPLFMKIAQKNNVMPPQKNKPTVVSVVPPLNTNVPKQDAPKTESSFTKRSSNEEMGHQNKVEEKKFEKIIPADKMPSMIAGEGNSSFMEGNSFTFPIESEQRPKEAVPDVPDEYVDDDDPGFELYEIYEEYFESSCKELANRFGFPAKSIKPELKKSEKKKESVKSIDKSHDENNISTESKRSKRPPKDKDTPGEDDSSTFDHKEKLKNPDRKELANKDDKKGMTKTASEGDLRQSSSTANLEEVIKKVDPEHTNLLPKRLKFPNSEDSYYPVECEGIVYDCFTMKVIFEREKTGFEETKEFPIVIGSVIAGRYIVQAYLGSAAFSKAIQCYDMLLKKTICMKIIENNKDYFDQSVDEIKLLRYIDLNGNVEEKNVLKFHDFFYHKEHLFIVTELLKDNLYEYSKRNRETENFVYFTIGRLQKITTQILTALDYIHSLHLIHCDLKPENILIKSYSKSEVKVIDFGSSCFIHDHLSSYVQSRSYRAPEVILGCAYDYKIDIWSLGCILAEMLTGYVLFQNDTIQGLLARVVGIIGPIPENMMKKGKLVGNFFTREGLIYQEPPEENEENKDGSRPHSMSNAERRAERKRMGENLKIQILIPKVTNLKHRLKTEDEAFIDFVRWLLEIDPEKRPTAKEAMTHRWLTKCKYNDGL